jgi:hypothetical protein
MNRHKIVLTIIALLLVASGAKAQSLLPEVQATYDACLSLQTAINTGSNSELRAANKMLKESNPKDFSSLRIVGDEQLSLDGHFVFDYEFVDSLIVNREVFKFAQRYAERASERSTSSTSGDVFTKTCMVKGKSSTKFTFASRGHQELAFVAEPGGMITVRVHNLSYDTWYKDPDKENKGKPSRIIVFDLPTDIWSSIEVEVINKAKKDVSFVVIKNL